MIDLKLKENEDLRVPLWNRFEEIADEYPELWSALEETFKCPVDLSCDFCFLMEKIAPILLKGHKAQIRYSMQEAEAVSSILYGALPRTNSCSCGLKNALNEISRENREYLSD
jgi:hypothetical protein